MIDFSANSALMDHLLKSRRIVSVVSITANATPASKKHNVDVSGVVYLRTEGKVAEADAIEDLSGDFTTAVDNSTGDSVFGVLITDVGNIRNVKKITVTELTALATSIAVTKLGTLGLTAEGNIAFNIAGTGLTLATESPTFVIEVEYQLAE